MNDPVVIDARGHRCPTPSLRLMKAMVGASPGSQFVLLATDPMAQIDVPFLMSQKNGRMIDVTEAGGVLRLTIETAGAPDAPTD